MKCGGAHDFDVSVESPQWNEAIRGGGLPDYLCLSCILEAFAKAGKPFKALLFGETFSGEVLMFSPVGYKLEDTK